MLFGFKLPKRSLPIPINTAKAQGPSKSPRVLDTPSPISQKNDAHCAIASSEAPAQSIITSISQKLLFKTSDLNRFAPFLSPSKELIGTKVKRIKVKIGITDQIIGNRYQLSVLKMER